MSALPRRALRRLRARAHELGQVVAIRREVRTLRRDHPGLTSDLRRLAGNDVRRVLLVSLSNDPEQIRLEAILAKAIELHGGSVTLLVYRSGTPWSGALFGALGLKDRLYFEDHAPGGHVLDRDLAERLERCRTLADYKAFEVDGARIGRQALSTVVRASREPTVDLDDPEVRRSIQNTIEYALRTLHVADRALDVVEPDCLLTVERGYAGFGSISDRALARGVPVIQFQAAHRDDAFYLKRYTLESRDLHPRSLDDATWSRLRSLGLTEEREHELEREVAGQEEGKWFLAQRHRHSAQIGGPERLRARLGLDPERKTAVVFSHILWDASMFYGSDVYPDQGRWFAETVRLAAEDDRVQWLVKLHPALYWKIRFDGVREEPAELAIIRNVVGELPPHMQLLRPDDDVSNVDLFRIIDAGLTIRGTVGIELPPLGVPVLTAGTSDYSGKGFTIDADTVEKYEANVRAIADLERLSPDQVRLARLYAYGIFCVRPWRFDSFSLDFRPLDAAGDTLEHRLRYNLRTGEELEHADDLRAFADWVLRSDEPDYVDEHALAAPAAVEAAASS
jgi:hypothetical protein